MPRAARQKGEFSVYHITQRGNEKKAIFFDDEDRNRFLTILLKNKHKYGIKIYAYCLMDNHIHLLLGSNGSDISQVMKSINVSFVMYINRKYCRSGHLFQDRFRSALIEDNNYALQASKYIHLNPVRAGMVTKPADYPWSSYGAYIGIPSARQDWLDTTMIVGSFGSNCGLTHSAYKEYVEGEVNQDGDQFSVSSQADSQSEFEQKILSYEECQAMVAKIALTGEEKAGLGRGKALHERNELVRQIRSRSNLSLAEIGELVGLSESRVSRIIASGK